MSEPLHIPASVIQAFDLMWGNFPISTMLLHKNRTILAVNKIGAAGGVKTGVPCFALTGRTSVCPHCEANEAVQDAAHGKQGRHGISYNWPMKQLRDCYWVPLVGYEDIYVHFGINITPYTVADVCEKHRHVAEEHDKAENAR